MAVKPSTTASARINTTKICPPSREFPLFTKIQSLPIACFAGDSAGSSRIPRGR